MSAREERSAGELADDEGAKGTDRKPGLVDVHVGGRLRTARRARNLRVREFAEVMGVSHTQLHYYETGRHRIALARLYEIAVLLEVEIGFFFEGLPSYPITDAEEIRKTERALAPFDTADQATFRVANALRKLPLAKRTSIAIMLEKMLEDGPSTAFRPGKKMA